MLDIFSISPGHHHFKQYYFQEWEERSRYIHDHIYSYYLSQDHAKNMNGGVWPTDFSKIRFRPGGINYIYNILTGYHYKAPYGLDVPTGKYFNPYFDHMVIGMKPVGEYLPSQSMTEPLTTMTALLPPILNLLMM
jgi:ubiquinol-cytochrome c reductase cytochrome c1 subunit